MWQVSPNRVSCAPEIWCFSEHFKEEPVRTKPQPGSRPGSVFEPGSSCHQADKYIVLSHTSAANDPSNAHQRCMPCSRQSPRSFEAGLLQRAPCKAPDYLWLNCPVWCVLLPDSSSNCLVKVMCLTPSVASSTGLTSRSVFVSSYVFSRVDASTGRLFPTCRSTVFRSVRSLADHTSVLPHLEICSFQRRTL